MKSKIRNVLRLMRGNPKLFFTMGSAEIKSILLSPVVHPKSPIQKKINGVLFEFDFDLDLMVKQMYFGAFEPVTVEAMKKTLKSGDTFIDVGASIGYLSCIGAGLVGKRGQVHSFEPAPKYFQRLRKMAITNPDYTIIVNNCALGEVRGTSKLDITSRPNIGWNTMVPNFMKSETINNSIEVPVYRLDDYIKEKGLDKISLIKIDVEGFEFPVLKGLQGYFQSPDHRPDMVVEIAPAAYPLLGFTLAQLLEYMERYHYHAFSLINTNAKVDITRLEKTTNVLFRASR